MTDGSVIARARVRRRHPPSPWLLWVAWWYADLLGMVASAIYHLAQHRDPALWVTAAVLFDLQTVHVHKLYLHATGRVSQDQPLTPVERGQWLLLAFATMLMLLSFVT